MRCPACGHENLDGAKFCNECGAKLELACPRCGKVNPPGSKFCCECGQPLSAPQESHPPKSLPEKWPQPYPFPLPKELSEKILAQKGRIEGERRQVTVMFCDLEGSTALTEKLGDERAFSLIDEIFDILTQQVHRYEGTVQEFRGDGIMALFGAPIALENAAQRAIRSALAIHQEVTKFGHQIQEGTRGTGIHMRIGIHTGPVVLGTIGSDLRLEFQVIGDTVNLAARMESLAEPGSTYVTNDTFKLTEGLFRFEGLGEKLVKGKETPVRVYRVIAPSSHSTRFDVSAEQGLTPFVGRLRERELLLDAFERARDGRGQAVSIVSEAGMGKSRLLYEFRKAVLNEDITFLEGKCLSFSRGVAYQPIADILKSNFDIREDDWDPAIKNKVKQGLQTIKMGEGPALPYLLELLSAKDSGIEKIQLSPEGKKDRTMDTLKKIILKGSEMRPLVIAIEDLHWIDKTSEDLLKYLLGSIAGARILFILTYRPEFIPTWGPRSYHNQLLLNRLSNRESLLMAQHILDTRQLESALEEVILEKTEGVPFFVEEFIKSLKDLDIIEKKNQTYRITKELQTVRIPSTIQDIIMARVDALPEGAKEVLQVGSLIEREFAYKLIKAVMHLPEEELLRRLSILKDAELLYERGLFPDSTFIFKHALTREVIYGTLLEGKKKEIHGEIGWAIEELYSDNIDEYCGLLAEHYRANENYLKASINYQTAARKPARAVSFTNAVSLAEKGLICLEKLPRTDEVGRKIVDARTTLGLYFIQLQHFDTAKKIIDPVVEPALKHDYRRRLSQIYTVLGIHSHLIAEDYPQAIEYLEKAIKMAEEMDDFVSLIFAQHYLGHVFADNCLFDQGLYYIGKALKIVETFNVPWSIAMHKACIAYTIYCSQGKIGLAYETGREALLLAEESGDILSKAEAYTNHGACCFFKGFLEEAEENLLKGIDFSAKAQLFGQGFVAHLSLGMVHSRNGNYGKAINYFGKAIEFEKFGTLTPSYFNLAQIALVSAKVMNHEKDIDLELLPVHMSHNKIKRFDSFFRKRLSEIFINIDGDHWSDAENWLKQAIEIDKNNGVISELGLDYVLYAELSRHKGDRSKAKELLGKAIELFKECEADGWEKKYEKEMAEM